MPQPPLSVTEAAEQAGEPRRTIQWAIQQGHLKAHKMPGRTGAYLIQQRDLDRWLTKREQETA
jgi:excisionase family DNA binding protein